MTMTSLPLYVGYAGTPTTVLFVHWLSESDLIKLNKENITELNKKKINLQSKSRCLPFELLFLNPHHF